MCLNEENRVCSNDVQRATSPSRGRRSPEPGNGRQGQRGAAFVEAAFCVSFFMAPFLIGLIVIGLALVNKIQLEQITRSMGIMHARGVNFALSGNQNIFLKLIEGSPFRTGSGENITLNGTVIVSTILKVRSDCACANAGQHVVKFRVTLGNPGLYTSRLANPTTVNASNGEVTNYLNDSAAVVPYANIQPRLVMDDDQEAYVAEGYLRTPSIQFPGGGFSQADSIAIF